MNNEQIERLISTLLAHAKRHRYMETQADNKADRKYCEGAAMAYETAIFTLRSIQLEA